MSKARKFVPPKYMSIWSEKDGDYRQYVRPDDSKLSWLSRWIYRVTDRLMGFVNWYIENASPTCVTMRAACEQIKKERMEHGRMLRKRYPDDYAAAVRALNARYGIKLE